MNMFLYIQLLDIALLWLLPSVIIQNNFDLFYMWYGLSYSQYLFRLQLLLWNPLVRESDSIEVERMKWFNLLLLYGAADSPDDDPK